MVWDDDAEQNKSSIDVKKEETDSDDKTQPSGEGNNWLEFSKTVAKRFIYVIIIGFIGANFIYLTGQSDDMLNIIFPTDRVEYFPKGDFRGQTGGSADKLGATFNYENCKMKKTGPEYYTLLSNSFPYNLAGPVKSAWSLGQRFKNFLALTTADTYMSNRDTLKSYIQFFAPNDGGNIFSNQSFQMLFAAPLNLCLSFIVLILGGVLGLFFALQADAFFGILGLICLFTWVIAGMIALIQFLQFWKLFLLEPILHDWPTLRKIVGCNVKILVILFGWLVCGAGFDYLDNTISMMMAICYCVLVAKMLWTSVQEGNF